MIGDLPAGKQAWPSCTGAGIDHPVDRRPHLGPVKVRHCCGDRGLRGGDARLQSRKVVARLVAAVDQSLVRVVFGAALVEERICLLERRLTSLVGERRNDVAGVHDRAAAHLQVDDDARGARHRHRAVVGLGSAGEDHLASCCSGMAEATRDLLHRRRGFLGGCRRGRGGGVFLGFGSPPARRDPQARADQERDGNQPARLENSEKPLKVHPVFVRPRWSAPPRALGHMAMITRP